MKSLPLLLSSVMLCACAGHPEPTTNTTPLLTYAELSAEITVVRTPIDDTMLAAEAAKGSWTAP